MLSGIHSLRDRYDAVLLDLDGTLLDGRSNLTQRTTAAVRTLADAGFRVVLCTGRSLAGTLPIHEALGLDGPVVAYNGHWIGEPDVPWQVIQIPDRHVGCIQVAEKGAHFSFRHSEERKYTLLTDHPEHEKVSAWYENVVHAESHDQLPTQGLMRVTLFFAGAEHLDPAWTAMTVEAQAALHREVFPLSLFPPYADSALVLCEVQARSKGKAEAYDWLARVYDIDAQRVIAVGDHMNDRTMLGGAGLAVVPDNADASVRPLADLVIGHHAQDGFARWIEAGAPRDRPARELA